MYQACTRTRSRPLSSFLHPVVCEKPSNVAALDLEPRASFADSLSLLLCVFSSCAWLCLGRRRCWELRVEVQTGEGGDLVRDESREPTTTRFFWAGGRASPTAASNRSADLWRLSQPTAPKWSSANDFKDKDKDEGSKRQRRISVVAAHAGKATDSLANTAGVSQIAVGIGKGGRSW